MAMENAYPHSMNTLKTGPKEKLNEIGSSHTDTLTALQQSAELVHQVIGSGVCIIELSDLNGKDRKSVV